MGAVLRFDMTNLRRIANGSRAALVRLLVHRGMTPQEAERVTPKTDQMSPRRALAPDELRAFLRAVDREPDPALRTILAILPRTGLRVSEACNLRLDAFREVGRRGNLRGTVEGKGSSGKGPKLREIPFGKDASRLLHDYVAKHRPKNPSAFVFLGPAGGRVTPSRVEAACRTAARRAGFPATRIVTPHVLRHTAASLLLARGWDIYAVKNLLGHGKLGKTSGRLPAVTLLYLTDGVGL